MRGVSGSEEVSCLLSSSAFLLLARSLPVG